MKVMAAQKLVRVPLSPDHDRCSNEPHSHNNQKSFIIYTIPISIAIQIDNMFFFQFFFEVIEVNTWPFWMYCFLDVLSSHSHFNTIRLRSKCPVQSTNLKKCRFVLSTFGNRTKQWADVRLMMVCIESSMALFWCGQRNARVERFRNTLQATNTIVWDFNSNE